MKRNGKVQTVTTSLAGHPGPQTNLHTKELRAACHLWLIRRDPTYHGRGFGAGLKFGRLGK